MIIKNLLDLKFPRGAQAPNSLKHLKEPQNLLAIRYLSHSLSQLSLWVIYSRPYWWLQDYFWQEDSHQQSIVVKSMSSGARITWSWHPVKFLLSEFDKWFQLRSSVSSLIVFEIVIPHIIVSVLRIHYCILTLRMLDQYLLN